MHKEKELYGYYEVADDSMPSSKLTIFLRKHLVGLATSTLLTIFILIVLLHEMTITIKAGERGVLYKRFFGKGVQLDKVYSEGLHLVLPWNIMTPYNVRIQEIFETMTVLTVEGMEIQLKLSIRYRPDISSLPYLHEDVGPNYAHSVLVPEVKGIVLSLFANKDVEHVYTTVYQLIKNANTTVKEDLKKNHIIIDELLVKSIVLPPVVRDAINEKIRQKQISLSYKYKLEIENQEAKRKTIEAGGIKSFQSIVSKGISENYLRWKGIDATLKLAESQNAKVVVIGSAKDGLPLILNTDSNTHQLSVNKNGTKTND